MEDKSTVDQLVDIAKAAHDVEMAQRNLETEEILLCSLPTHAYPETQIHVHKGIEKLAAEAGKEIIVDLDWSSTHSEWSFTCNGVKFFQLKDK